MQQILISVMAKLSNCLKTISRTYRVRYAKLRKKMMNLSEFELDTVCCYLAHLALPHLTLGEGRSGDRSHRAPDALWVRRLRRDFEAESVKRQ